MQTGKAQQGFTLVEIAIVMVIIGLLLGGALKGQEMIENARLKRVKNDFDQISAAIYSYIDIYRAMPGDNINADTQHGAAAVPSGGNAGDGQVNGPYNANNTSRESRLIWQHLRSAGLINGAATDTDLPRNAFSGVIGFTSNRAPFLEEDMICFDNLDTRQSMILDNQYDDGAGDSGTIRDFDSDTTYTGTSAICFSM